MRYKYVDEVMFNNFKYNISKSSLYYIYFGNTGVTCPIFIAITQGTVAKLIMI